MNDDGKPARVTAFSKERGFGRVAVDEGELVFDTSVAQCAIDHLAVGVEVRVTTGPGRIGGPRKVTRLWRNDAPMPSSIPPSNEPERFEAFGPYQYLMPPFWPAAPVMERGPIWSSGANLNDVQCVLLTCLGGAADPSTKADLLAKRSVLASMVRCDTQVVGIPFEGYRFDRGLEIELFYVLASHGDLLTVSCIAAASNERAAEAIAPLLVTIVGAAVHRRGPDPTKKSEGGFWKRLFGRA